MFKMSGPLAALWSQGHRVGTLRNWELTSERPAHFILTGTGDLPCIALPESLRPPLEVRIGNTRAPVRAVSAGQYIGLDGLKEVL